MASLDIFNNDAFSVTSLVGVINDIPEVPTQIGDEGLFEEYGITTTIVFLQRTGAGITLVPAQARGGPGQPPARRDRKRIPLEVLHLPQVGGIDADQVQGVVGDNTESEVAQVSDLVRDELKRMKDAMDLTKEHLRLGAIKGKVMDADGTTELYDLYQVMGFTQEVMPFDIDTPTTSTDPKLIAQNLRSKIRSKLGGKSFTGIMIICSLSFFQKFTLHNNMKKAWELWNAGAYNRTDQTQADFIWLNNIVFRIYEGGTDQGDFIPADTAYAYPTGVAGLFKTAYAPANYIETVNKKGLPYYAKAKVRDFETGVDFQAQSNPLMYNTLPETVIKLITAATAP